MLQRVIDFSLKNKFIVLLATVALVLGGVYAVKQHSARCHPRPLGYAGHHLHAVGGPGATTLSRTRSPIRSRRRCCPCRRQKAVRGYSFYGFSFVYVIFEDGTDPYWARSRVLEYLSSLSGQLPKDVTPSLGPDATGVGWAFMYSINSTNRDLAELRSIRIGI